VSQVSTEQCLSPQLCTWPYTCTLRLQWWQVIGNVWETWSAQKLNLIPPVPNAKVLPLVLPGQFPSSNGAMSWTFAYATTTLLISLPMAPHKFFLAWTISISRMFLVLILSSTTVFHILCGLLKQLFSSFFSIWRCRSQEAGVLHL